MVLSMDRPFSIPRIALTARAAIAAVCMASVMAVTQGCTNQDAKQVVQQIADAIPTVQADVNVAASIIATIDPAAAPIVAGIVAIAGPALTQLRVLCNTYATTADPTVLGSINEALNTLLNTSATSLLDAAKIVDPVSRATALRILSAIQTALLLVYSIYQRVQTKAQVKATAALRTYKLSDVAALMNEDDRTMVVQQTGRSFDTALQYELAQGF